jgi:hypothetical protein
VYIYPQQVPFAGIDVTQCHRISVYSKYLHEEALSFAIDMPCMLHACQEDDTLVSQASLLALKACLNSL